MKRISLFIAVAVLAAACTKSVPVPQEFHVIPMPAEVNIAEGAFCVKGVQVYVDPAMDELSQKAVGRFVKALETASGVKTKSGQKGICFTVNADLAPEAYTIDIKADGASVQASALNGFIYACETLKQMLPAAIYGNEAVKDVDWALPLATISDAPRFAYRGMHLDPCRHFFTIEET